MKMTMAEKIVLTWDSQHSEHFALAPSFCDNISSLWSGHKRKSAHTWHIQADWRTTILYSHPTSPYNEWWFRLHTAAVTRWNGESYTQVEERLVLPSQCKLRTSTIIFISFFNMPRIHQDLQGFCGLWCGMHEADLLHFIHLFAAHAYHFLTCKEKKKKDPHDYAISTNTPWQTQTSFYYC